MTDNERDSLSLLLPVRDSGHAPEAFADDAIHFDHLNGVIRMTLASVRTDFAATPIRPCRVVMGQVTMPIAGAHRLAAGLLHFLKSNNLLAAVVEQERDVLDQASVPAVAAKNAMN